MYRHLELTLWIGLMLGASYIDFRHRMVPDWLNLCIAACSLLGLRSGTLAGVLCAIPFLLAAGCWGGIGGGDIKFMAAWYAPGNVWRTEGGNIRDRVPACVSYGLSFMVFMEGHPSPYVIPHGPIPNNGLSGCVVCRRIGHGYYNEWAEVRYE
ncbi:MAG: prepilin peptidase [Enterocloster sp.]